MLAWRVCRAAHASADCLVLSMFTTRKTARSAPSVYQTTYALLRETLRGVLRGGVKPCGSGTGSIQYWACAALYELLDAHPVDQRGRCRSCRRQGVLVARRGRCHVYTNASYWLHYSDQALPLPHLASEVPPRIEAEDSGPPASAAPQRYPPGGMAGPESRQDRG